ncbi:MAG: CBS domain-containing protein [Methylocapsa sp.]|nr:CBS domain-containing protein [Methylocapsa sp.]
MPVRDAMTQDVKYCLENADLAEVTQNMGKMQVRRMPAVNRAKRLVRIISLADLALKHDPETAGVALTGLVEPGGSHTSP